MRNSLWILLVLGIFMGVFPIVVSADMITDANVTITVTINDGDEDDLHDENGWLVAGSSTTSKVNVTYSGTLSPEIHYVRFTSFEPDKYGDFVEGYVDSEPYDALFVASENCAGNASLGLQINYSVNEMGYDYFGNFSQPIDHAAPMKIQSIAFDSEVTIDKEMNITMTLEDAYGNMVTSLYEDEDNAIRGKPENVVFSTTPYAGSCFYDLNGYDADMVTVPVNAEGKVLATFKAGIEAGPKYLIHITPAAYVNDKWLTVTALADAEPYEMSVSVLPNEGTTPYVPADGVSKFYLTYNLYDRYHNPSGNQVVRFTDDVRGDVFTQRTNSYGQIMFTFGPFDTAGTVTINATAVENTSVTVDQEIRFTNTSPEDMLLTANPQSMPSADVDDAEGADILAKVMDENGNGVPGEVVRFSITNDSWNDAHELDPYFDSTVGVTDTTATTNVDGIAKVNFTPGAFIKPDGGNENYNATASESCVVEAEWRAKTRSIDLEWKNYPYLRVETGVSDEQVNVGDSVDVTIRLVGDGWALSSDPIDVMLCADRSGSMSGSKIQSLTDALKVFNGKMIEGSDRVGMVSFGNSATRDLFFTTNRGEVDNVIDELRAGGYTSMRDGLYQAIKENINDSRAGVLQAVILLSDGDYNYYGDPLARGTNHTTGPTGSPFDDYMHLTEDYYEFGDLEKKYQNLSVYATSKNISIYSIALGDALSTGGNETLKKLAQYTGGKYYYAPDETQLKAIYTDIAGELKNEAGVNTAMDVKFESIEVNNVSHPNTGDNTILAYEHEPGVSTRVKSWNASGSECSPNIKDGTLNQTDDWVGNNHSLNFDSTDIGTIHLGQTWQAVFRLRVSKSGNINIFGEDSSGKRSAISFNDGADTLPLPKTYITAVDDLNATGINFARLEVYDLGCVENEKCIPIENYLTMDWNLSYSGNNSVTQCLYYEKVDDGVWTKFCTVEETDPPDGESYTKQLSRQLYVADFPPGEYKLRVHATASDTPDSVNETMSPISIGTGERNYIRLE